MRVIILAAGKGSRLQPATDATPKTLLEVAGKPMLGHILDAVRAVPIDEVIICCGYLQEQIRAYCQQAAADLTVRFVENLAYVHTNNMYSLYLCRDYFDDDCVVMNADLVFDAGVLAKLLSVSGSAIAVAAGVYGEEAMKITVQGSHVTSISKQTPGRLAYGSSVDVYKFTQADMDVLLGIMRRYIEDEQASNMWTEVAIDAALVERVIRMVPVNVEAYRWFEIDTIEDLSRAEVLFLNDSA